MRVVVDHCPDLVGPWIAERAGCEYVSGSMTAIGLLDLTEKEIVAGLLYEKFNGTSITIHQAIARPGVITKDFLWYVFHYPFVELGCERLTGIVAASNTQAIELNLNLGFEIEARLERACPSGDIIIMRMFRENCRFLKRGKANGQQR